MWFLHQPRKKHPYKEFICLSHHRFVVLQHDDKGGILGELPPSSFLSQNERKCQKCGERFIPTVHKNHQKYCKKCGLISAKEKRSLCYRTKRNFHTTIRINTTEKAIIKKYGINLSKFVREMLYKYDKALKGIKVT